MTPGTLPGLRRLPLRRRQRQPHVEGRSGALLALEADAAAVLLDDDRPRDGEPLPAAAADLLGREERIEDAAVDGGRDADAGVADRDADAAVLGVGRHADLALAAASFGARLHG